MMTLLEPSGVLSLLLASSGEGGDVPIAHATDAMQWAGLILWLPLLSMVLCGLCAALRVKGRAPAWITVALLGASFALTVVLYTSYTEPVTVHLLDWFDIRWGSETGVETSFAAHFSLYVDGLSLLWMLFVTGLGTLIALYAGEYMEHDLGTGYSRFFAGMSVFLFAMSALVLGDNLLLLYLGWEGVGFASYWLIGYYYQKPSAVAAAKKAFIMNRIGDLGLALGIYLIWHYFGTVQYAELFTILSEHPPAETAERGGWFVKYLPFLFMLGAFGKSAQIPLYVWLPDAMEGPTPVSALIHAATMVTAGVYLLARMYPVMLLHDLALPTVAWIGGITALLSATIGMAQFDIKRIMAYSTVSQLGYMFVGIGVMTTFGAAYHVFTHAFFKAVLFLTCGAIMHGFAGQLDLRRISGLRHMPGWRITAWTMLIGCLCLAGFPGLSGYFSKDAILAQAFITEGPGYVVLGWIVIITAGLTAYYAFRVWFRVCAGAPHYEMGDEHHGDDHEHDDHAHEPHAPRLAINGVNLLLAIGAVLAAIPYFMTNHVGGVHGGWVADLIADSTAAGGLPHDTHGEEAAHATLFGADPHKAMYFISGGVGLVGLLIAWWLHLQDRKAADRLKTALQANVATRWLPRAMENKWYVDEIYIALIRSPLWILSHIFYLFDRYVIDIFLVDGVARVPRWLGRSFQPLMNGVLQSYALSMAGGVGLVAILVLFMPRLMAWLGGGG